MRRGKKKKESTLYVKTEKKRVKYDVSYDVHRR